MIHMQSNTIWVAYRLKQHLLPQCLPLLDKVEQQYALVARDKRAHQFANGRALLRSVLQQQLKIAATDIHVALPTQDAPQLTVCGEPWRLSISHSHHAIAVAVSRNYSVGIDLEQLKPRNFSELSRDYIALKGAESSEDFYRRWTAAEAYSKLSKQPLIIVLQQPFPTSPIIKHLPLPGYMLCLCYQHESAEIIIAEEQ